MGSCCNKTVKDTYIREDNYIFTSIDSYTNLFPYLERRLRLISKVKDAIITDTYEVYFYDNILRKIHLPNLDLIYKYNDALEIRFDSMDDKIVVSMLISEEISIRWIINIEEHFYFVEVNDIDTIVYCVDTLEMLTNCIKWFKYYFAPQDEKKKYFTSEFDDVFLISPSPPCVLSYRPRVTQILPKFKPF